jgi:hypothetical protein
MAGLVIVKSNADLVREEQAQAGKSGEREAFESQLAAHIRKVWERNRRAKEVVQERMLKCMRQRNGQYDAETLNEIRKQGGSEIYMMLTATKCRAAKSWITDIEVPAGANAWFLEPTPIPDLPPDQAQQVQEAATAKYREQVAQGEAPPDPQVWLTMMQQAQEAARRAAEEHAKEAMERMSRRIEDQLAEGGWVPAMEAFIDDLVTFPSAILKGPVVRNRPTLKWGPDFEPVQANELRVEFERVSPYDVYPSPYATTPQEGDFIERVRLSRRSLYQAQGIPGYSAEAIRAVLEEYGRGGLREWLWRDYERTRLEGRGSTAELHDPDTLDGLHFWGSAQGLLLLEWGMPADLVPDVLSEYEIEAILIGRHVIRVRLNDDPLMRRPYYKASFHQLPGAFWGLSPPELMADIEQVCNSTARALVNNQAIASGPQVEVYMNRLADGQNVSSMYPWKIWQMKDDLGGSNNRAISFFQPNSISAELLLVYEQFERRADDATQIPRYAYGNERVGGAGATMGGLQLLLNSVAKGIKEVVMQIDLGVVVPAIEQLYTFNMLYDNDPAITGDPKVRARGATALIAKDQQQQRREQFLALTANPIDMSIIGREGRAVVLRAQAETLDLPEPIVPETYELREQEKNQQPPPEVELEKAKLQISAEKVQLDAQAKELKTQLDAQVEASRQQHETALQDDQQAHDVEMAVLKARIDALKPKPQPGRRA